MSLAKRRDFEPLHRYATDPSLPAPQQLARFLQMYGLEDSEIETDASGCVDVSCLLDKIPEKIDDQINPAYIELYEFYMCVPARKRSKGVKVPADRLLAVLMDRTEFYDRLMRGTVRVCKGSGCPHFSVCPYKDIVGDLTLEDGVLCAVEREVVRGATTSFLLPHDGRPPAVDAARYPEKALLFQQLVELLVRKTRLSMYLQMDDLLVDQYEILKSGDTEYFAAMNQAAHPLLEALSSTQESIRKVMQALGITPEFQIKQGLYVDDADRLDAERRAREIAIQMARDVAAQLPEGDQYRLQLEEAISRFEDEE
ncbi:MAG: hypothetical protein D6800_06710 [Candidatus Zixiibacteriota bacterium]|nr:MAG: hypothetical protein D6800_06710 [candidate division Zixibacteria bacterium]